METNIFIQKANAFKRPLKERMVLPTHTAELRVNPTAFQGFDMTPTATFSLPIVMNSGDKIWIDFSDHCVGYLHFTLENAMESPYGAPEINSACHAWSCTPAYWLRQMDGIAE